MLARADFLTLHLPLNDETRGVIDAAAIAKMKDGVRLVNAARGELVDEDGAARGARARARSPPPRSTSSAREPYSGPLLDAPNVVVTPHLAASTDEAQDRAGVIVAEQVVAALEGGLVTNAVNIPSIGAEDLEVLGPFVPLAAKLGRLALELARGETEPDRARVLRRARRVRHAPAHRRGAERRLPGPQRPAGELRERAARRRRARDRGGRGEAARLARLHEPRRRHGRRRRASRGRRSASEHRHWLVSALGFEIEIELAPRMVFLRLRRRARA